MKGLKSSAQCKYDLRYHFVWIPRYRKRVLEGTIKKRLEGMIRFAAQIHEWDIFELVIQSDHVHLYLGAGPKWSPSEIMRLIKGGTSNKIREMQNPTVKYNSIGVRNVSVTIRDSSSPQQSAISTPSCQVTVGGCPIPGQRRLKPNSCTAQSCTL